MELSQNRLNLSGENTESNENNHETDETGAALTKNEVTEINKSVDSSMNTSVASTVLYDKATNLEAQQESMLQWTHIFAEFTDTSSLSLAMKGSARIKYTCLSFSKTFIGFGTNTGAIHLYNRESLKHIHVIPAGKEGGIAKLSFSPNENVLGYAVNSGLIIIIELNISSRGGVRPERLRTTGHHKDAQITQLKWSPMGNRLFCGDDKGIVSVAVIPTSQSSELLKMPSEVIMRLDSPVVQIDTYEDSFLVSTHFKSYIGSSSRKNFTQIGIKPRDGKYGACFYVGSGMSSPIIYAARPGSRIWEADHEGNVLNTHQLKILLDIPSLPIVSSQENYVWPGIETKPCGPLSVAFPHLYLIGERYLVSLTEKALIVFNPAEVKVVFANRNLSKANVIDIGVYRNTLYILNNDQSVKILTFSSITKIIKKLIDCKMYHTSAQLCLSFQDTLTSSLQQYSHRVTADMICQLKMSMDQNSDCDIVKKLNNLISHLSREEKKLEHIKLEMEKRRIERMPSGIYVIKARTWSVGSSSSDGSRDNYISSKSTPVIESEDREIRDTDSSNFIITENIVLKQSDDELLKKKLLSSKAVDEAHGKISGFAGFASNKLSSIKTKVTQKLLSQADTKEVVITANQKETIIDNENSYDLSNIEVGKEPEDNTDTLEMSIANCSNSNSTNDKDKCIDEHKVWTAVLDDVETSESLSSENVSINSAEFACDAHSIDPEPIYAKSVGPVSKGKKKKASLVSFDESSTTMHKRNKIKRSQSAISRHSLENVSSLRRVHSVASEAVIAEIDADGKEVAREAKESDLDWSCMSEYDDQHLDERKLASKFPFKISSVTEKLSNKARSIVQSVKDTTVSTKNKLVKKEEMPAPFDVACYSPPTNDEEGGNKKIETNSVVPLQSLTSACMEAENKLSDAEKAFDPQYVQNVLTNWVEELHRTAYSLHLKQFHDQHLCSACGKAKRITETTLPEDAILEERNENISVIDIKNEPDYDENIVFKEKQYTSSVDEDDKENNTDQMQISVHFGDEIETCTEVNDHHSSESSTDRDICQCNIKPTKTEILYVKDPFIMPAELHLRVQKLTTMCFEFGVYGDLSVALYGSKVISHQQSQDPVESSVNGDKTTCDILESCKVCDTVCLYPQNNDNDIYCEHFLSHECKSQICARQSLVSLHHRIESHPNGVNKMDSVFYQTLLFIKLYFHLFNINKLFQTIRFIKDTVWRRHLWCFSTNLLQVVSQDENHFNTKMKEERVEAAFDLLRSNALCNKTSYLGCLYRLFEKCPIKTMDFCAETFQLTVLDVVYLTGEKTQYLLHYLLRQYDSIKNRSTLMQQCCSDLEIYKKVLEVLLSSSTPSTSKSLHCSCGEPAPFSHLCVWPHKNVIENLIECGPKWILVVEKLCRQFGYWRGLAKVLKEKAHLAKLLLQLNDCTYLTDQPMGIYLPSNEEEWLQLLQIKERQHLSNQNGANTASTYSSNTIYCLGCGQDLNDYNTYPPEDTTADDGISIREHRRITWQHVAEQLVAYLGPRTGLKLLSSVNIPDGAISTAFFQACVHKEITEKQQRILAHNMLEKVDTYLWSKRSAILHPKILPCVQSEQRDFSETGCVDMVTERMISQQMIGTQRPIEEPSLHWGSALNVNAPCAVCGLPLWSNFPTVETGLQAFECGHAFHRTCNLFKWCLLCIKR